MVQFYFCNLLQFIFLHATPLKYTSPRSCALLWSLWSEIQGVLLWLTPWPNTEGQIIQTQVPFFSICLANCCCEMMFWLTICTTIWRAPRWCVPARSSLFSLWGQVCLLLHAGYYRWCPLPSVRCCCVCCRVWFVTCILLGVWSPIIKLRQDYPHHPQLQVGCHSSFMACPPAMAAHAGPWHCLNAECQG